MDEEKRAEIRELWKRERMRNWISIVFVLALVVGFPPLILLSCLLWMGYLLYCIRNSEDRGTRITNMIVAVLPVGVFIWTLIALFRG